MTPVPCEVRNEPKKQSSFAVITQRTACVLSCFQLRLNKQFCIQHTINAAQPGSSTPLDEIGACFPLRISTDERNRGTACGCFCVIDTALY